MKKQAEDKGSRDKLLVVGLLGVTFGLPALMLVSTTFGRHLLRDVAAHAPDIPLVSLPEAETGPVPPTQPPPADDIARQEVQLSGSLVLKAIAVDATTGDPAGRSKSDLDRMGGEYRRGTAGSDAAREDGQLGRERLVYSFQASRTGVSDVDIRGFLDGSTKYDFNQGTANHMRVGRRYNGYFQGRLELKRSLIRWDVSDLQSVPARVVDGAIHLWAEPPELPSPLSIRSSPPIRIYAYPIGIEWTEGNGGEGENSMSPATTGESYWLEARRGERAWPAPGALSFGQTPGLGSYAARPLAFERLRLSPDADTELVLRSEKLASYVEERRDSGGVGVLLKLDDMEEARLGTSFGLITSEFGNAFDYPPKGPALQVTVEVDGRVERTRYPYVLETGGEVVLPIRRHAAGRIAFEAVLRPDEGDIPPKLYIRGGSGVVDTAGKRWHSLDNPVVRDWDWSQVKISSQVNRVRLGEEVHLRLDEFWVKPGPRTEQTPRVVLIAPSGDTVRRRATPASELSYETVLVPDEVGLWRYGWCFRAYPELPKGTHCGKGVFYVGLDLDDPNADRRVRKYAETVKKSIKDLGFVHRKSVYQLNTLSRLMAQIHENGGLSDRQFSALRQEIHRVITEG